MKRSGNIGMNGLAQSLKKIFAEKEKSNEGNFVQKTYEGTDDNFFEATNTNLCNNGMILNITGSRCAYADILIGSP